MGVTLDDGQKMTDAAIDNSIDPKFSGLNRNGRKRGSLNKNTLDARKAIAELLQRKVGDIENWLEDIYEEYGALVAFRCVESLLEYHVPKLSRAIVTGEDGPIEIQVSWAVPKPTDAGGTITIAEDGTRITGYKEMPPVCRCCGGDVATHKRNERSLVAQRVVVEGQKGEP